MSKLYQDTQLIDDIQMTATLELNSVFKEL